MRSLVYLPPPNLCHFTHPFRHTTLPTTASSAPSTISQPPDEPEIEHVPDSLDPAPLFEDEESIARSELSDAPLQVPWELLHAPQVDSNRSDSDRGNVDTRAVKRVRIRTPVLVIETPERGANVDTRTKVVSSDGGSEMEGELADKSRVFLGESDSENEPDISDAGGVLARRQGWIDDGIHGIGEADTRRIDLVAGRDGDDSRVDEPVDSAMVHVPRIFSSSSQYIRDANEDSHETVESPTEGAHDSRAGQTFDISLLAPQPAPAVGHETTASDLSSVSTSLPIRAPLAGPTCRFTFFSRNPRPTLDITKTTVPNVILYPPEVEPPKRDLAIPQNFRYQNEDSLRHSLPTINAFEASYSTLQTDSFEADATGMQSIIPPPTLHFSLASITPVQRILSNPIAFLSAPRPILGGDAGAASTRVNLLVVVKEVGELCRVRCKLPMEPTSLRGGMVDRMEIIVMDGHIPPIGEAEKYLFKIILWNSLTYQTTIQPGDVISLTNLSLTRQTPHPDMTTKRLGTGLPRFERFPLIANASPTNNSHIELCYRSDVKIARDGEVNFDPELAMFDLRSRRILELSRLWQSSVEHSHR